MFKYIIIFIAWVTSVLLITGNILNGFEAPHDLHWLYFLVGAFISYLLVFKRKNKLTFYMTFEHELTHNIWAMLTFNKPMGFHVNTDGSGLFQFEKGAHYSNIFITLSPYFFPTSCILWLVFYEFFKVEYHIVYFSVMGLFFGYQVFRIHDDFGPHQSDIQEFGMAVSLLFIIPFYFLFFGLIIALTLGGWQGIYHYYVESILYLVQQIIT